MFDSIIIIGVLALVANLHRMLMRHPHQLPVVCEDVGRFVGSVKAVEGFWEKAVLDNAICTEVNATMVIHICRHRLEYWRW